ncbi:MAG: caspase family protein [Woeseia sp.]|nr:caspase family protein [Woeseia sp.]NNE60640.1 caspase family protein [Woeseia sp.]NNL53544.1 caspase family protein [Woeseia sp.]
MAKGISLHIGVNEVDPEGYPLKPTYGRRYVVVSKDYNPVSFGNTAFSIGWVGNLSSCELDAENMFKLAKSQKFDAKILKTRQATTGNVIDYIRRAAKKLKAGDTFLMSYSGHGAQVEDLSGDEADGEDETWCLYDRMFLDDEQRELYAEFAKGVKLVVMSDSCHSGSATRSVSSATAERQRRLERGELREMEERTAVAVYLGRKKDYDEIQRSLKNPPPPLKASRILFSACQDYEHAMGYDDGGVFTVALLKVWDKGKFKGGYGDLARKIRDELQANYNRAVDKANGDASRVFLQVPNFVRIEGSSRSALDEFIAQRPFEI